jgi:hypothetical protein
MNCRSVSRLASLLAALSILLPSLFATPALGQAPPDDANRWEFTVAPYLLFPHMDGQTSIRGNPVDVDVGPSEIFERLDFGAMLYMEMANRDWAITLDGLYMNLGETGQTPITGRDAEVNMKQLAVEATGMRRVAPWAEIGIGGRINSIEGGLFVAPGEVVLPGIDVSDTKTWFDPLIVARLTAPLVSRWQLGLRGDVGGFGIGSEFAWQVFPYVGYRFGRVFELAVGYRAIGVKYDTGSGDDFFLYDMVIFGPQIGLKFHF